MKQAIVTLVGNEIAIDSPYNPEFVDALKDEIPYGDRRWDREHKTWVVSAEQADKAIEIAARFYQVVDARQMDASKAEDVKIKAELAQIRADQALILENEAYLEERIERLDAEVEAFSPRSKSPVKYNKAADSKLYWFAIKYARTPAEELTEMQVKSLAKVARMLRG
jgi:uncharacterized protein YecE (DUF72 family)